MTSTDTAMLGMDGEWTEIPLPEALAKVGAGELYSVNCVRLQALTTME